MFPRQVKCEDCGQIASVRGFGRIEYDWPETTMADQESAIPTITCIRLTIDCPHCGVKTQEFFPDETSPAARRHKDSLPNRRLGSRGREVRFQRLGPTNRPRL